ncbi:helix-turn-helix transcriptional regulator [Providencia rettgeri]|nr:helix-turn-helix transcriptional regulator [Providencia rettgeri]ELR5153091.1 helix-turn-helix transcriptional regulator [Providencia rettgeri]
MINLTSSEIIGLNIRKRRNSKGMSGAEFADVLSYSQQHISRIELGNVKLNLGQLSLIAEALDSNLNDLLAGIGYISDKTQEVKEADFFLFQKSLFENRLNKI